MNKLWVSFPLSWCMPSGSKDSCPRLTTPGAVPVIRGHGTRGSSGTLDKDLICKGHLSEGRKRNAEVFVNSEHLLLFENILKAHLHLSAEL